MGEKWSTGFHLEGLDPRPEMPIFIAALSPAILERSGCGEAGVTLPCVGPIP